MTLFCMFPVFNRVYEDAYKPLSANEISISEAYDAGIKPVRLFMARQMEDDPSYIMNFMILGFLFILIKNISKKIEQQY